MTNPRPHVRLVTFNRPERLNAIDDSFVEALHTALDEARDDDDCRILVLTGAGRAFCAGFDMKGAHGDDFAAGRRQPVRQSLRGQSRLSDLVRRLRSGQLPVVAAVNGPAAGGGFALALAADVRFAAPSAVFLVANVKLGLSGGEMGIAYLLPRVVGSGRAAELMLTGRKIGAAEAERWGLVNAVADEPVAAALDFADSVVANGRFGIEMTKELLTLSAGAADLGTVIALENRTQVLASMTEDMEQSVAAFRAGGARADPGARRGGEG